MPKAAKKIVNGIFSIIVAAVVIAAVLLLGASVIGLQVFKVISGSMEPAYSVGDLIYVKEIDPEEIKPDMVITFIINEDLVIATHRVVSVDKENQHIYTKGDANETADAAPVHFNNVIGTPVFKIPLLGYVSDYIQSPHGTYIAVGITAALLLAVFIPDMVVKKSKERGEKDENE